MQLLEEALGLGKRELDRDVLRLWSGTGAVGSYVNIHISGSSVKNFFDNHMDKIMFLIDFIKLPATPVLAQ